ncbi:glycerol-3-phosphate 1-O-acyltransferase PlsY [uncultured Limosilactobacillus sp.]|uniref:glycerol-3-phosphate 1-O-acyltransferase PlsY n=1 Tax=uncultured Limosilactobacillus sp. TaxID=2837629 RepID=UPI0025F47A28|nr:glycerol-3-phosphate 1-O-acyltransferase PlsY [uncultured Limosilactobacillus sp.]
MLSQLILTLVMILIAYLLGSIPSGLWIGLYFYHKDLRRYGSGNIGTTNTFRILGNKAGTIVFIMDVLKGSLATCLPYLFHSPINPLFIGFFAAVGHVFSIFDHFKGGKAVATSSGVLLAYNPLLFLVGVVIFTITFLLTSMVSVGSLVVVLSITIIALIQHDWILSLLGIVITIGVYYLHRSNIQRIIHGQESMVSFGLGQYLRKKHSKN